MIKLVNSFKILYFLHFLFWTKYIDSVWLYEHLIFVYKLSVRFFREPHGRDSFEVGLEEMRIFRAGKEQNDTSGRRRTCTCREPGLVWGVGSRRCSLRRERGSGSRRSWKESEPGCQGSNKHPQAEEREQREVGSVNSIKETPVHTSFTQGHLPPMFVPFAFSFDLDLHYTYIHTCICILYFDYFFLVPFENKLNHCPLFLNTSSDFFP